MKIFRRKKTQNYKIKLGVIILIISLFSISVGYSALRQNLTIGTVSAAIEPEQKVIISSFIVNSSSDQDSYSNSESHTNSTITANVLLNDSSSWVKYEIKATNLGNEEMGIANYLDLALPENITYEIEDYTLKDPICDDTTTTNCTLNAEKTFYITIKYKEGIVVNAPASFIVGVGFDFQPFYSVTYATNVCNNCSSKAIANASFTVVLNYYTSITIKMNNYLLTFDSYSFDSDTGELTINNVTGDIEVINTAYTRLEYIETTGQQNAQYIDSLYVPHNNTTVVYDGMVVSGDTAIFGVREAAAGTNKFTMQYISKDYYRASYKAKDYEMVSFTDNNRHLFRMNNIAVTVDGEVATAFDITSNNLNPTGNLYFFAVNSTTTGGAGNFGQVRLYSVKIYENDELVRHYIPVLDSNQTPCLYEKVYKKYYYLDTSCSGTLNYQTLASYTMTNNIEDVTLSNELPSVLSGDSFSTTLIPHNRELPTAIQVTSNTAILQPGIDYSYDSETGELEIFDIRGNIIVYELTNTTLDYLVSTGTQYIKTGYIPNINTRVVFTHVPLVTSPTKWAAFFGTKNSSTNADSLYVTHGVNQISAFFGGNHIPPGTANVNYNHIINSTEVIMLSATEFKVLVDGIEAFSHTTTSTPVFSSNLKELYIFGRNAGGSFAYGGSVKFVSMQIYEGASTDPIMDFSPVRDSNGEICLIDNVSGDLYYKSGTGNFSH